MIHGGISDGKVHMDFSVNLNPLGTPREIREGMRQGLEQSGNYPEYSYRQLRTALAGLEGVDIEEVLPGNGASELIPAIARAVSPGNALLIEPGFYGYRHGLQSLKDCHIREYVLKAEKGFTLDGEVLQQIGPEMDLLFLTNPWNPFGYNLKEELLRKILQKAADCRCAVVLDESFLLLSQQGERAAAHNALIHTYPNLYIIRSFTKLMAIPGIRIGYVLSDAGNLEEVKKQLPEWNISQLADHTGRACGALLAGGKFQEETLALIRREREFLKSELEKRGIRVFHSDTCFLLLHSEHDLYNELLEKQILIRDCSGFTGLQEGYFRIAVKDHESNRKLIEALDEIRACKTGRN